MPEDDGESRKVVDEMIAGFKSLTQGPPVTTNAQITNNHGYHPPSSDAVIELHTYVRGLTSGAALWMNDNLPECDEKQDALKAIRLAMMWANAAIACHSNAT